MQWEKDGNQYMIHVEKNEKIMEKLTQFCEEEKIENGFIYGIGAVKKIEIGAFDVEKKIYIHKEFSDTLELTSYHGNITLKDGKPFIHAHITLGNHNMELVGGHLFEATVSAVGEFQLQKLKFDASRKLNEDVGLPCICLSKKF